MRPQKSYRTLVHFMWVLGQFHGRCGELILPQTLHQIDFELHMFSEVTATEVKKATRKLKLTKYIENLYYSLFAVTGKQPHLNAKAKTRSSGCSKLSIVFGRTSKKTDAETS